MSVHQAKGGQVAHPSSEGRQALIKALHTIMLGDFGHDLPDNEFWCDADQIIAWLDDAGFEIARKAVSA